MMMNNLDQLDKHHQSIKSTQQRTRRLSSQFRSVISNLSRSQLFNSSNLN